MRRLEVLKSVYHVFCGEVGGSRGSEVRSLESSSSEVLSFRGSSALRRFRNPSMGRSFSFLAARGEEQGSRLGGKGVFVREVGFLRFGGRWKKEGELGHALDFNSSNSNSSSNSSNRSNSVKVVIVIIVI